MIRKAKISVCGNYRYSLTRIWDKELPRVMFIMLNPSIADAEQDDPTIRRCIGFAKDWGYGGLYVANIYSFIATDPKDLKKAKKKQGPKHFFYLQKMVGRVDKIIMGYGAYNDIGFSFDEFVLINELPREKIYHLGLTKYKAPRHPLYLSKNTQPIKWRHG